jgi:hypothetical protein
MNEDDSVRSALAAVLQFAGLLTLAAACATAPRPAGAQPARAACLSPSGALADTLYVAERLHDAEPPVPLRPDLAPYPPDADGEYRVWFRGQRYIASGMPVRVSTTDDGGGAMLVRVGDAGAIPVFRRADDPRRGKRLPQLILAPITYDCVFLPYDLPESFRG